MLKKGFYCALGTPLDKEGRLIKESLIAHIENQIQAGASGFLLMGTMGMMGCIRQDQYESIVQTAVQAVNGRVTLMVGAQDNSIARIKDRLNILNRYDVAVVLTAPYYFAQSQDTAMRCFREAAALTDHDVYLYDHPYTARYKLTCADVVSLSQVKNIKGVKTGDAVLIKTLCDTKSLKADFTPIFSNSDLFAVGHAYGIHHILDGIFGCFPATIGRAQRAFDAGDFEGGKAALNALMDGRDAMFVHGIWPCFSYAMNLLGFPGNFAPDYEPSITDEGMQATRDVLAALKEI
ncbi:dihydrodipicolinate synthase family protein [Christensenellaceae bacterium OttesenSCG-928-M15]|nr:dihydrodipicolinate synthase family protein [Christensenellaceae bacterium OttesenSCG-928-M15]